MADRIDGIFLMCLAVCLHVFFAGFPSDMNDMMDING